MSSLSDPPQGARGQSATRRARCTLLSFVSSILAWVVVVLMLWAEPVWPRFFISSDSSGLALPTPPFVLLLVLTVVLWLSGLVGGCVVVVRARRGGAPQDVRLAWMAIATSLVPPVFAGGIQLNLFSVTDALFPGRFGLAGVSTALFAAFLLVLWLVGGPTRASFRARRNHDRLGSD